MVSRLLSSALAFIGLMFMTRYLAPQDLGLITWSASLVATVNAVSDLGFLSTHIKKVSEGKDLGDCVATFALVKLCLTGAMSAAMVAIMLVWYFLAPTTPSSEQMAIIALYILYNALLGLSSVITSTYEARTEVAKSQFVVLLEPLVRVPILLIVLIATLGNIAVVGSYIAGAAVMVLASWLMFHRDRMPLGKPRFVREYALFALPIAAIPLMTSISNNLDKIMVGIYWTDADVGYLTSAQILLSIMGVAGMAVSVLTLPTFSKLGREGLDAIRKGTLVAERYISLALFPITVALFCLSDEIALVLLGSGYAPAGSVIRIMALAIFLNLLNQVVNTQFLALNRPDMLTKVTGLSLLANLVLLLLLVPRTLFGIHLPGLSYQGAALASLGAAICSFITVRIFINRLTGIRMERRLARHAASAAVTGVALFILATVVPATSLIHLALYLAISYGIFIGILSLIGEFTRDDLFYVGSILNPGQMREYLRNELKRRE